ncbi:unnamed protein product [Penicillium salamii]|nr:unnamed protein product [Penicillium salamii]CAG8401750.1 unnamed protein product [Penicillium salamii]
MDEIQAVHSILHLIFHRNKNQHHRTKWWKWLSMLKRATLDLAQPLSVASAEAQKQYLATHLIPRCYVAFSTVVADNQFSTLGVVLMAALARLSKITGITQEMKKHSTASKVKKSSSMPQKEDLGERIRRVEPAPTSSTHPVQVSQSGKTGDKPQVKEKPVDKARSAEKSAKKTKKKKNAIDDLFSGLF